MVDRNGVQLAIGRRATTVYANPKHIADPRAAAIAAGKALRLDPDKLYGPLADQSRGFVYVARKADAKRADALQRKGIQGLGFYSEERRVYPRGSSAPMSSGTRGWTTGPVRAGAGAERDARWAARPRDRRPRPIRPRARHPQGDTGRGGPRRPSDARRDAAGGRVDSALDGAPLGCARRDRRGPRPAQRRGARAAVEPGFDANRFPQTSREVQRNRAVTDTYEPGSTLKVVTVAGHCPRASSARRRSSRSRRRSRWPTERSTRRTGPTPSG